MTELENVVKGLECCLTASMGEPICPTCTYRYDENGVETGDCEINLLKDALALLKAHEPQVMSIGDLYGYDMGFYERRDEELIWPVLISRGGPDDDETVGFVRKDGYELRSDCGLMNITWRIWTAYPPHELREATPWE